MAILLIGSTGNGKSCLGNFLIDPSDDHLWKNPTFATATANLPETDNVQEALSSIKLCEDNFSFRVIDTPGLNDKDFKVDIRHMIGLIEALQKESLIRACILVLKFDSKIDAQFTSTVQYYRKLLPSLFERNVLVVMTAYSTDDRSIKIRERKCIDTEKVKENTVRVIVESGCLTYEPIVFLIDSLPVEDKELELNLKERSTILEFIESLSPIELDSSKVAKTNYILQDDRGKIASYHGEITGYNERLKETQEKYATKLQAIEETEKKITEIKSKLKNLKEEMDELNTDDPTVINAWTFSRTWKFFQTHEENFNMFTEIENASISRWDNGKCTWELFNEKHDKNGTEVSGKLVGRFMRGLYASVTITAAKKYKYSVRIVDLMNKINIDKEKEQKVNEELQAIVSDAQECINEVELLQTYITEKRQLIDKLDSEWMTLEEAREEYKRLSKI